MQLSLFDLLATLFISPDTEDKRVPNMSGSNDIEQVDVLLVGAGFASYTLLNR